MVARLNDEETGPSSLQSDLHRSLFPLGMRYILDVTLKQMTSADAGTAAREGLAVLQVY